MNERRVQRLTREMSSPERTPREPVEDDGFENLVRVVAIAILVLLVFTFATWPHDEQMQADPLLAEQPVAFTPAFAWGGKPESGARIGGLDYSPIY